MEHVCNAQWVAALATPTETASSVTHRITGNRKDLFAHA